MYSKHHAIDTTTRSPHNTAQNMKKGPIRPIIGAYARISLDDENDRLGVERQRKDVTSLASSRGWEIYDYYVDNNISAYKRNIKRPEFERLIADLESGAINGIVAYDIDRVTRQPLDLERIVRIYEDRPGLLFATAQGSIDLSNSNGIFMARTLVNVANKSSADTSRRQKRKNLERAERGLPHGSRRPYGYALNQIDLNEEEAAHLREMAHKIMSGVSYRETAYWMNESGYRTTEGALWHPITVRNTLARERYAGFRIYDGVEYEGIWTPVFTREEWEALRQIIKERKERVAIRPNAKKYLLTGYAVCGRCGTFLNGETKRDPAAVSGKNKGLEKPLRRIYNCRLHGTTKREAGCGGVIRNADALEHFIRELVCARLDSPAFSSLLTAPDTDDAVQDLAMQKETLVKRMASLVDDYADGTLDKAAYVRAKGRLEARVADIESQLDQFRRSRIKVALEPGEKVREAWMRHGDGWRRELIDTLIDRIIVNVGKTKPYYDVDGKRTRFDPNLIEVKWKV